MSQLFACWVIFVGNCSFSTKLLFSKISLRNTIRVPNCSDPDQDQHYVGPDHGFKCLQHFISGQQVASRKEWGETTALAIQ